MRAIFYLMLVLICSTQTTVAMVDAEYSEVYLKRTILVEERTAIWCPSCAEIDPELELVAESHGSRIAIVGIHVTDEFENNASRARVQYQKQVDNSSYGTPTFFVDGLKTAEGYGAWEDVQKRILTQENKKTSPVEIAYDLSDADFDLEAPEIGQLTIMVLEHGKEVPDDADRATPSVGRCTGRIGGILPRPPRVQSVWRRRGQQEDRRGLCCMLAGMFRRRMGRNVAARLPVAPHACANPAWEGDRAGGAGDHGDPR